MNRLMESEWTWVEASHNLRSGALDLLTEADLAFSPGGANIPLGALLKAFGEIEHSYVDSFRTFRQDFSYRNNDAGLEGSLDQIRAWFGALDAQMKDALAALSDIDLDRTIERGSGYAMPVTTQVQVYLQALMIFFGKLLTYLRAMNKPISKELEEWIG
jgi:hypothetical protein